MHFTYKEQWIGKTNNYGHFTTTKPTQSTTTSYQTKKKKSHKENWKNREQQKNKIWEREKYTSGEQPVRWRWNSGTGERIPRLLWNSGWIISPLPKLSSNFLSLSQQFKLFSFSFYFHTCLSREFINRRVTEVLIWQVFKV